MVVDAGGSTVDTCVYLVKETSPKLILHEARASDCVCLLFYLRRMLRSANSSLYFVTDRLNRKLSSLLWSFLMGANDFVCGPEEQSSFREEWIYS